MKKQEVYDLFVELLERHNLYCYIEQAESLFDEYVYCKKEGRKYNSVCPLEFVGCEDYMVKEGMFDPEYVMCDNCAFENCSCDHDPELFFSELSEIMRGLEVE